MKKTILACFLLYALGAFLACGDTGSSSKTSVSAEEKRIVFSEDAKASGAWPDPELKKVFTAYWAAALDGRREDVYDMEADYVRQLLPKERYLKTLEFLTDPKKLQVLEVGVPRARSAYLYEVPLKLKTPAPAQGLPSPAKIDHWVKTDSGWHHAVKPSLLFPELGFGAGMAREPGTHSEGREVRKSN